MTYAAFAADHITLRNDRISGEDGARQERTAIEILHRLASQPGVVLADEVGMGKTYVALSVAASIVLDQPDRDPVVIMVPPSLRDKWPKEWNVFAELCLSTAAAGSYSRRFTTKPPRHEAPPPEFLSSWCPWCLRGSCSPSRARRAGSVRTNSRFSSNHRQTWARFS
jgi:hypothetical protein